MFDPVLRPIKDKILGPLARALPGVPPGAITALALLVGLGAAGAAWRGAFVVGLVLWLANRVLDGLDGAVARIHGKSSDLGGYFDLVADFVVYGAIPVALALRPGAPPELTQAAVLLLAVFYVNTAAWMVPSALLEKRGYRAETRENPTSVSIPEGAISGGETVLFFSLFFLLPSHQVTLFLLMTALTAITVLQRLVWGAREFGRKAPLLALVLIISAHPFDLAGQAGPAPGVIIGSVRAPGPSGPAFCEVAVDPKCPPSRGEKVEVFLHPDRMHVFKDASKENGEK